MNQWLRRLFLNQMVQGLRADLSMQGVWTPQVEALLDIKVIDKDAPSHLHRTRESIWNTEF